MLCGWYLKTQKPGQFYLSVLCGPWTILETSATPMSQSVHNRNTRRDPSNPVKFTLLPVFASKGLISGPVNLFLGL